MPPTDRKSDFCCWAAHARLGDSCGSSPERLGTSDGGGGAVPYGCVPTGPESNITIADPSYGNDLMAGSPQNGDDGSYEYAPPGSFDPDSRSDWSAGSIAAAPMVRASSSAVMFATW